MNEKITKAIKAAQTILVPKGDDNKPCLDAFTASTGIVVPDFPDRKLSVTSDERMFVKVKGRDIPALIASGYGDIGLTGSDSCEDYLATTAGITYACYDKPMCRFVLLAPKERAAAVRKKLAAGEELSAATSFPKLLRTCAVNVGVSVLPTKLRLSGSVEIMPQLLGVPLVADLVATGTTAKSNGLVEVQTLLEVYPAVAIRDNTSQATEAASYDELELIDATFKQRSLQVSNTASSSYTLNLLRDSNKAGKKAGEEFGEVMMAIFGDGSPAECESEIADLIYAQLAAAYSRNKPIKLGNVVRILIERNQQGAKR
jgi:ATP phosphoribosyltransferase